MSRLERNIEAGRKVGGRKGGTGHGKEEQFSAINVSRDWILK